MKLFSREGVSMFPTCLNAELMFTYMKLEMLMS